MASLQRCHPVIPRWSVHSNKVSLVSAAELKQVGASQGRLQRLVPWNKMKKSDYFQWIGLRENLQETIEFPIKYGVFL